LSGGKHFVRTGSVFFRWETPVTARKRLYCWDNVFTGRRSMVFL
jgi:hypothetical protein